MRVGERNIIMDDHFGHLFTRAKNQQIEIKGTANVSDTLDLMQRVVGSTLHQTKKIADFLRKENHFETCRNIWNFCFHHIQYKRDQDGIEQVRSPARAWQDRISGIDCDCLTVLISSMLTNLGIPCMIRLTGYKSGGEFEHVYPIALTDSGTVILDCVVHRFNYEVPYKFKKDVHMKLHFLNGLEDNYQTEDGWAEELSPEEEAIMLYTGGMAGLFGKAQREARRKARREKAPEGSSRLGRGLNIINKLNPATALVRAGVLASMKLNVGKVAGKLRYTYLSEGQATQLNIIPSKFSQLVKIRQKLEKLFYGAGGNPANLKKAILEGKGNRDRKVALNGWEDDPRYIPFDGDLETIIGQEVYSSELAPAETNLSGLGEPITAATAIASASGIIATISALIKQLGEIFQKGTPEQQQEIINDNTADQEQAQNPNSLEKITDEIQNSVSPELQDKYFPPTADSVEVPTTPPAVIDTAKLTDNDSAGQENLSVSTRSADATVTDDAATTANPVKKSTDDKGGLGQWIKDHPLLSAGIATGIALGLYYGIKTYREAQQKKQEKGKSSPALKGVEGTGKIPRVKLL